MDCTPFIRTKWVMAAWLITPVLLIALAEFGLRGFYNQQQSSYKEKRILKRLEPQMTDEADYARMFLSRHRLDQNTAASIQNTYITLINSIADETDFTVETINLTQKPFDEELGTFRLEISLQGVGSIRQIARFMYSLKQNTPLMYEDNLIMVPSGRSPGSLQINVNLIRMFVK